MTSNTKPNSNYEQNMNSSSSFCNCCCTPRVVAAAVVRTVVIVLEKAHARPRFQEPPGLEIGTRLRLGMYSFLERFFDHLFSIMEFDLASKNVLKLKPVGLRFLIFLKS